MQAGFIRRTIILINFCRQLEHHFREQQRFAEGYSPLYAHLFAIIADWLASDAADPVVGWLVEAAAERPPFDVTLLLMAALHRDVLAGEPAVSALARFYATVGGEEMTNGEEQAIASPAAGGRLADDLRDAIIARRDALGAFIRTANVQTNETGRGLAWLLPATGMGWEAVHLVELGASAGLNLVADRRGYRLVDADDPPQTRLQLGQGPPQFTTLMRGTGALPASTAVPTIRSRTGGDVRPFYLRTADDELMLASFIWGDQAQRMARLREGIAALRSVETSAAPVRLAPLNLPDGLSRFLAEELPRTFDAPVILYNTVVTLYLPDHGASLRDIVAEWAGRQPVPVLWLQWEPWWDGPPPPDREWMAWTADYWPHDGSGESYRWHLAWVHPHGKALEWLED